MILFKKIAFFCRLWCKICSPSPYLWGRGPISEVEVHSVGRTAEDVGPYKICCFSVEQNRLKFNLTFFQSFLESLKTFLIKGFQRGVGQSPAYSHRTYGAGAPYRRLKFIPWDGPPRTSVPTKFVVFSVEQNRLEFSLKLFQSVLKGGPGENFFPKKFSPATFHRSHRSHRGYTHQAYFLRIITTVPRPKKTIAGSRISSAVFEVFWASVT